MAMRNYSFKAIEKEMDVLQEQFPNKTLSELVREGLEKLRSPSIKNLDIVKVDNLAIAELLDEDREFFGVPDVAKAFGKHQTTVRTWCQKKWLPAEQLGKEWVIHRSILAAVYEKLKPRVVRISDKLIDGGLEVIPEPLEQYG